MVCWLQTYGSGRRGDSVTLEFPQGLFTPGHTALDGSCHLHLRDVDTTQSEGCSSWEVSGPFGIGHIPRLNLSLRELKNLLVSAKVAVGVDGLQLATLPLP